MIHAHQSQPSVRFPDRSAALVMQVCLLAISIAMAACGQTVRVSVSSSSPTVLLGNPLQFAAIVTGSSDTSVTWSVNDVVGGSSTVGTITSSGLYTAPMDLPNPAGVAVTATSQADKSKSGTLVVTVGSNITVKVSTNPGNQQPV